MLKHSLSHQGDTQTIFFLCDSKYSEKFSCSKSMRISLKTDCSSCYYASVCLLDITMPAHTNLHLTITSLYWHGIEALKALEIFSATKQLVQNLLPHYASVMFKSMIISKQQIFIQYQIVFILLGNFTYLAFGLVDQMISHKVGVPSTLTTFVQLHLTNQGKTYKQRL